MIQNFLDAVRFLAGPILFLVACFIIAAFLDQPAEDV